MDEVTQVLASHNRLGEGPIWNSTEQALYWVDILDGTFWRYHPASDSHEIFYVGVPIGVMAFRAGGGLVMATKQGFAIWDEEQRQLKVIANPIADQEHMRFNDGAVDCAGRFWAGTVSMVDELSPEGVLYRLDPDYSVHVMETGICVSNGIGWSPDNTVMYFTDSPRRIIYAYDFDVVTGAIANRRIFARLEEGNAVPDGLAVDSAGYVWSACWDGAKLIRYAPDGRIERAIAVPAQRPTSCVFGGEALDELYITSAWNGLDEEALERYPLSGDLFRLKAPVKGLEKYAFAG
jgi:sugar lactone lactonase YvrE